ncbi:MULTISPECIES: hypothetical protein [unclassified Aureispira]|uniref:hypothetical protein n=1 Tax=unclassified Aureispira TaxID=2649989 RepID=UPI0012DED038|nr:MULTISPECIES: hypothetical protein [unclassified Aureispira]WMX15641.1 hypothetical protein QP953_04510 [Aureispira sp. CCB-E]
MNHQEETNNYNIMKVIGLGILMIVMLIALFNKKDDASVFGIPGNTIQKTDTTITQ